MAHVVSISVDGLNGRPGPIDFALNRDANVFFGQNGSGKTSLLRIIESAMNCQAESVEDVVFRSARAVIYSVEFNRNFTHEYAKPYKADAKRKMRKGLTPNPDYNLTDDSSDTSELGEWIVSPAMEGLDFWRHVFLPTSRLYLPNAMAFSGGGPSRAARTLRASRGNFESYDVVEKGLDATFAAYIQAIWGNQYGETLKEVGKIQEEGLQKILAEIISPASRLGVAAGDGALDASKAFERMTSFLRRQSHDQVFSVMPQRDVFLERYTKEQQLRNVVRHIDDVETRIDAQMQRAKTLEGLVKRLFSGKSISFDGPTITVKVENGDQIGLDRLSSGEKHLIRILLAAMEADVSTLIVDEPELSMHIDWQRELIASIHTLNPSCQLILATHSPEIMSEIDDSKIFRI